MDLGMDILWGRGTLHYWRGHYVWILLGLESKTKKEELLSAKTAFFCFYIFVGESSQLI
jgi:hypothetical protein